ncbi:hypothetical protein QZN30_05465 [Burkholderia multivorans]|jgi:hypothetical protein|nr:hypothetical protein [Burkholderia multivorans]
MQVASIIVEGSLCRDMYDEHPGFAYFYVTAHQGISIPHPLPLSTAMAVAEAAWKRDHVSSEDDDYEEHDGQFTPESILLLSADRETVQHYRNGHWVSEFIPPEEWDTQLCRASELSSEASIEAGWDNFSTAERLSASATAIRRQVDIARNHHAARLADPVDTIRGLSERVSLAMARIATAACSDAAPVSWRQAKRGARALGIREGLAGLAEAPVMFEGEPVLLKAWQEGVDWALAFLADSVQW